MPLSPGDAAPDFDLTRPRTLLPLRDELPWYAVVLVFRGEADAQVRADLRRSPAPARRSPASGPGRSASPRCRSPRSGAAG